MKILPNSKSFISLFATTTAVILTISASNAQTTIVDYEFTTASTAATTGSSISSLSAVGGISVGGYSNWVTGTEAGTQFIFFNAASGAGKSIDISLDATGFQDVTLGNFFQLTARNNGAAVNWQLSYSTDGGSNFTQIGSDFSIAKTGNSDSAQISTGSDFSLGTAADNNPNIVFRLNSAPDSLDFNGSTAAGGQVSFDNFTILATASIPEPSSFALLAGLFAMGWIIVRRR